MTERREWEEWWDADAPENFRRYDKAMAKSHETNKAIAREIAKVGGTVLDVGCATGITYEYIKKIGVKYTGLDFTKKFLKRAREINPEIDVRHGSAFDIPFKDKSFDTVFCKSLLEHQHPDEYHLIVREMARVAKKQVILAFFKNPRAVRKIIFTKKERLYSNIYSKKEIVALIKALDGFKKLDTVEGLGKRKDALYIVNLGG